MSCYFCNQNSDYTLLDYSSMLVYGPEHGRLKSNLSVERFEQKICISCAEIIRKKKGSVVRSANKLAYQHIKEVKEIIQQYIKESE